MDTKRRANAVHAATATRELLALIERWQPDVMIAADDNASRYVIAPHFRDADVPVVMMTAYGTLEAAVQAMQEGAFHYVEKPVNTRTLLAILARAVGVATFAGQ